MIRNKRRIIFRLAISAATCLALAIIITLLIRPIALTEAFLQHNHCIKILDIALAQYASEHGGHYPTHTNGYGDALLLLRHCQPFYSGPGYSEDVFRNALLNNTDVPESQCGRVYIQGLNDSSNPEIAIVFDKSASPGDHLHGFPRLWAPLGREVVYIGSDVNNKWFILESDWTAFSKKQIELLVSGGIPRPTAEGYYRVPLKTEKTETPPPILLILPILPIPTKKIQLLCLLRYHFAIS